jgi:hypothetical protein
MGFFDKFNNLMRMWKADPEIYPIAIVTGFSLVFGGWVAIRKWYLDIPDEKKYKL